MRMKRFFSPSTAGWYCSDVHGSIPADSVEVTETLYRSLLGKEVELDESGTPCEKEAEPPGFDQRKALLLAAVDEHLHTAAKARGYDSIINAALRAALPNSPFHAEGVALGEWMDQVYAKCYDVLTQVQTGAMAEPTQEQLLALLPVMNLPRPESGGDMTCNVHVPVSGVKIIPGSEQ